MFASIYILGLISSQCGTSNTNNIKEGSKILFF